MLLGYSEGFVNENVTYYFSILFFREEKPFAKTNLKGKTYPFRALVYFLICQAKSIFFHLWFDWGLGRMRAFLPFFWIWKDSSNSSRIDSFGIHGPSACLAASSAAQRADREGQQRRSAGRQGRAGRGGGVGGPGGVDVATAPLWTLSHFLVSALP